MLITAVTTSARTSAPNAMPSRTARRRFAKNDSMVGGPSSVGKVLSVIGRSSYRFTASRGQMADSVTHVALDHMRRVRPQIGEAVPASADGPQVERGGPPARAMDPQADRRDVAERERAHARDGRVVEQPQEPALGD